MATLAKNTIALVLVAAVGAGGYLACGSHASDMQTLSEASLDWPVVPGLVTRSTLEHRHQRSPGPDTRDSRVEVSYEYVVDGTVYRNDRVRFDQQMLSDGRKEALVNAHPAGKPVEVFYDPDDPDQSVLVRGSWAPD